LTLLLCLSLGHTQEVIRGYKDATLYASPGGAALEGLEGRLSWTLCLVVLVPELPMEGAAGGGVGGGAGSVA